MARFGRSYVFPPHIHPADLGPVYFDNSSQSIYEAALSTYNWAHVVGTNANRFIAVAVSIFAAGTVSSITVGGLSLTFKRADATGIYRTEVWYGVAPNIGSQTITVNLSGALTSIAQATSYWNVDQTTPISADSGLTGTNTPASGAVTPGSDLNRVFGVVTTQTASGVSDQIGQALRQRNQGALGTSSGAEKGIITPAGATTLTWNGIGAIDSWASSLIAIQKVIPPTFQVGWAVGASRLLSGGVPA